MTIDHTQPAESWESPEVDWSAYTSDIEVDDDEFARAIVDGRRRDALERGVVLPRLTS